jgi:Uma2 family endonuclease
MSTARRLNYSYEDYLRALEASHIKLEYCDGQLYAMAGGTPTHAQLGARIIRLLGAALASTCEVYTSDLKVRIEASDLSTFPDATIVCGNREVSIIDAQAVTNPRVVVEVTSRSTEQYDRGEKFRHYKQLASLEAVLFVSHRAACVTIARRSDAWTLHDVRSGERVELGDPCLHFAVDDLYAGVELEAT